LNPSERPEPLKVWLVNPPLEDPWRTQGDYRDEQKRSRRLYTVAFASIVISAIAAVATSVSAMATLRSQSAAQAVRVECVAPLAAATPASVPGMAEK
jgi:hypothetical protein